MTIKLENVSKRYGKKLVLSDINLKIPTGSFTMFRGVSGSGKSTLLSIIGGIEPITSGQVLIDEQNVRKLRGKARTDFYRRKVGFIFQGFYLQPQLTVADNIALAGVFAGMARKERKERAKELANMLGIAKILNSFPAEISGG